MGLFEDEDESDPMDLLKPKQYVQLQLPYPREAYIAEIISLKPLKVKVTPLKDRQIGEIDMEDVKTWR